MKTTVKPAVKADAFLTELRRVQRKITKAREVLQTYKENSKQTKEDLATYERQLDELIETGTPGLFEGEQ